MPYSLVTQPYYYFEETDAIIAALTAPIRQYLTKIEWLDWSENIVGDYTPYVLDGNISADASNNLRRTFSATIDNTSGLFVPNGVRTNMGVKVRLSRGIQTAAGIVRWNKGIFVLTDPEASHSGAEKTVKLQGVDKWALFSGDLAGTLTDTTIIPNGTNVADAIMAVASDGGESKFSFDVCTVTTPYTITKEPGNTRADLMLELALIPSWELYYDANGYLRFRPAIDPLQKQVVADLSAEGHGAYRKVYIDGQYRPEWSRVRNYWKVTGYSDSVTGITYSGVAQNNNPESPTNTATPPAGVGPKPEVLTDENLTTDNLCEQRAGYELRQNLRKIDRSSHNIVPLPFLLEGDCVQLEDDGAGIDYGKYEIQAFTEPLGPTGLMKIECWRAVSIFEVVLENNFQSGLGSWQQLQSGIVDVYGISGDNALRKQTNDDPNGGYCLLAKNVTDFELILYTRRDTLGTATENQYSVVNSSGSGYGIGIDYGAGTLRIEERAAWAKTNLANVAFTPSLGEWYALRLQRIGPNLSAEVHMGKTSDFTSPLAVAYAVDTTTTSFDRAAVNGGYVFYTDNVVVRKLL